MSEIDTRPGATPAAGQANHPADGARIQNVLSVDLEDWAHGLLGGSTPITDRVIKNVDRMLGLLQHYGIKATFFALGKACAQFPQILPRVAAAGHEIASHGYSHQRVDHMTPQGFRDDVQRSIDVIGEQIGAAPLGYRAPQFSITAGTLWAGPILSAAGFKYSSSVFPFRGPRYGIEQAPRFPYRWQDCDLIEFPLSTLECLGRRVPVSGGGYLRLLPWRFMHAAMVQANAQGQPAVIYMHPYELDVDEVRQLVRRGLPISRWVAFKQALFRGAIPRRLAHLFERFEFATMGAVLEAQADHQTWGLSA